MTIRNDETTKQNRIYLDAESLAERRFVNLGNIRS